MTALPAFVPENAQDHRLLVRRDRVTRGKTFLGVIHLARSTRPI
jgi:hypothetical protein